MLRCRRLPREFPSCFPGRGLRGRIFRRWRFRVERGEPECSPGPRLRRRLQPQPHQGPKMSGKIREHLLDTFPPIYPTYSTYRPLVLLNYGVLDICWIWGGYRVDIDQINYIIVQPLSIVYPCLVYTLEMSKVYQLII